MGEARSRRQIYERSRQRLLDRHGGQHRIVAESAVNLSDRFILPNHFTGACYQITMTLEKYLAEAHGIASKTIVGYVNDGTDDIRISHAWLEFDGMKIDIGLHVVDRPDVTPPGAVIILDEAIRPGAAEYSYHLSRPPASMAVIDQILRNPSTAHVARWKEVEHADMLARSRDTDLRDIYLAGAPAQSSFASMTSVLR